MTNDDTQHTPAMPEIDLSIVHRIKDWAQTHQEASIADVMAEFDISYAQFQLAVRIIQAMIKRGD